MKLGHVVKAGLLVGAFASSVQAQSLTGSINGTPLNNNGTNGIVSGPVCDIGSIPVPLPTGRTCTFSNFGTAANGSTLSITGTATQYFDLGTNTFNYALNYSFSGTSKQANTNFQAVFGIPMYTSTVSWGSSTVAVTLSLPFRGTSTFLDGAPAGPSFNVATYNGVTNLGSQGLSLQPGPLSVTRGGGSGPAVSATDTEASGVQPINQVIDHADLVIGFNILNSNDPVSFSGSGALIFTSAVVPEPSTYVLFATGLVGLAAAARRRRRSV